MTNFIVIGYWLVILDVVSSETHESKNIFFLSVSFILSPITMVYFSGTE